ncbi:unnamed protein product [Brachionus calyciflorus]|uniref:Chitin-binding type-2 domain-containing protein n=1 Tax=Brachionus calyciflorus TaxID=104777 RepID=A0A813YLZ9_9BILA|nr:unnamed protein product [Brachionus calyciflorus]
MILCENVIRTPTLIRKTFTNCTDKDDFKSDEVDCTLFHRCAFGYQYTYVCPSGTGFDAAKRVCNFLQYVPECISNGFAIETTISATDYPEYPVEETEPIETTTNPTTTTIHTHLPTLPNKQCKFNLNQLERNIFCNSSTFRFYYPTCCFP